MSVERGAPGTLVFVDAFSTGTAGLDPSSAARVLFGELAVELTVVGPARFLFAVPPLEGTSRVVRVQLTDAGGTVLSGEWPFSYVDVDEAWRQDPIFSGVEPGELTRRAVARVALVAADQRSNLAAVMAVPGLDPSMAVALQRAEHLVGVLSERLDTVAGLAFFDPSTLQRGFEFPEPPRPLEMDRMLRTLDVMVVSAGLAAGPVSQGSGATSAGYAAIVALDAAEAVVLTVDTLVPVLALGALAATLHPPLAPLAGPIGGFLLELGQYTGWVLAVMRVVPTDLVLRPGTHLADGATTSLAAVESCPGRSVAVAGLAQFRGTEPLASSILTQLLSSRADLGNVLRGRLSARLSSSLRNVLARVLDFIVGRLVDVVAEPVIQDALRALVGTAGSTRFEVTVVVSPSIDLAAALDDLLTHLGLSRLRSVIEGLGVSLQIAANEVISSSPSIHVTGDELVADAAGTAVISMRVRFFSERTYVRVFTLPALDYGELEGVALNVFAPCCDAGATRCTNGTLYTCGAGGAGESPASCPSGQCERDACYVPPTCAPACTLGASRCSGSTYETCQNVSGCAAWAPAQPPAEVCNGLDDDCNGMANEPYMMFYTDADGDGWGTGAGQRLCAPAGNVRATVSGDCDDSDPLRHPGLAEVWDVRDNDCDGAQDEDGLIDLALYHRTWSTTDWEHRYAAAQPAGFSAEAGAHWLRVYPAASSICNDPVRHPYDSCSFAPNTNVTSGGRPCASDGRDIVNVWAGTFVGLSECIGVLGTSHITLYLQDDGGEICDYRVQPGFVCQRIGYVLGGNTATNFSTAAQMRRCRSPFNAAGVADNLWTPDAACIHGTTLYDQQDLVWWTPAAR